MAYRKQEKIEAGIWRLEGAGYLAEVNYTDPTTGQRRRTAKTIHQLDMAREWRQAQKTDALRGEIRRVSDRPTPVRFDDFADRYLSDHSKLNKAASSYQRDINSLKHLRKHFSRVYLQDLRRVDVEAYVAARKREGLAPGTINRELSCLKNMLRKAVEWEILEASPAAGVTKQREGVKEFDWPTEEEAERLVDACADHLKPIIIVALHTGMRKGELLGLKWTDVDFKQGLLTVRETKNGDTRHIPMTERVRHTLNKHGRYGKRIVNGKMCPYVFSAASGEPLKTFRNGLDAAVERAGINKHIRPHDLRHTFASHLVMNGVDLRTVAKLGGWRDIQMVMRYAHLAPDHLKSAVAVLEKTGAGVGQLADTAS